MRFSFFLNRWSTLESAEPLLVNQIQRIPLKMSAKRAKYYSISLITLTLVQRNPTLYTRSMIDSYMHEYLDRVPRKWALLFAGTCFNKIRIFSEKEYWLKLIVTNVPRYYLANAINWQIPRSWETMPLIFWSIVFRIDKKLTFKSANYFGKVWLFKDWSVFVGKKFRKKVDKFFLWLLFFHHSLFCFGFFFH